MVLVVRVEHLPPFVNTFGSLENLESILVSCDTPLSTCPETKHPNRWKTRNRKSHLITHSLTMGLTEEQKERIRKNRERALAIQKKRKFEKQKELENEKKAKQKELQDYNKNGTTHEQQDHNSGKKQKMTTTTTTPRAPMEDFEMGASDWCTKKEAKEQYCLPEGTLAVCEVQEKENPHHKGWTPMKLYRRSELRERAHKRYGGLEGLVAERNKRRKKRLDKDMKEALKVFE